MVENITSPDRSGLRGWLMQRITSLFLGAYTIFLFIYLLAHPQLSFMDWQNLYANIVVRIFSFLVLLSLIYHAWIGVWTVITDYIKPVTIRLLIEIIVVLALICFLVWGIEILWGI